MNLDYAQKIWSTPNLLKHLFSVISSQPKPIKFLISRFLILSGLCQLLKIKRNGYLLYFYPTSLSAQFWISPQARFGDESFLYSYLKKGDKFVDIGANIGTITIVASQILAYFIIT